MKTTLKAEADTGGWSSQGRLWVHALTPLQKIFHRHPPRQGLRHPTGQQKGSSPHSFSYRFWLRPYRSQHGRRTEDASFSGMMLPKYRHVSRYRYHAAPFLRLCSLPQLHSGSPRCLFGRARSRACSLRCVRRRHSFVVRLM